MCTGLKRNDFSFRKGEEENGRKRESLGELQLSDATAALVSADGARLQHLLHFLSFLAVSLSVLLAPFSLLSLPGTF